MQGHVGDFAVTKKRTHRWSFNLEGAHQKEYLFLDIDGHRCRVQLLWDTEGGGDSVQDLMKVRRVQGFRLAQRNVGGCVCVGGGYPTVTRKWWGEWQHIKEYPVRYQWQLKWVFWWLVWSGLFRWTSSLHYVPNREVVPWHAPHSPCFYIFIWQLLNVLPVNWIWRCPVRRGSSMKAAILPPSMKMTHRYHQETRVSVP